MSEPIVQPRRRPGGVQYLDAAMLVREHQRAVDQIAAARPARVLDWGAGHGITSKLLLDAGLSVTSLEYDPDSSEGERRAAERYPGVEVELTPEPVRLPYEDESFDAVLSMGVLEHVTNPEASLSEIHRVLTPGGALWIYKLPNRYSYLEWVARRFDLPYHGMLPDDTIWTVASARAAVERHGYEVEWARRANMLPLTVLARPVERLAGPLWRLNTMLDRVPGLNLIATNVELLAVKAPLSSPR
jgi:SAM-dependent methyltransferase